jgi:hypothetical protein
MRADGLERSRRVDIARVALVALDLSPAAPHPAVRAIDLEAALRDPASVFVAPEDVAAHPDLSPEQKIEILRLWQYDAAESEVAVEEGMPGNSDELLRRIVLALDGLGEAGLGSNAPSKHHAVIRRHRSE